jgi:hypothetical protein
MSPRDICQGCDHFCANNEDGLSIGCRAFPGGNGIPNFIEDKHSHDKVVEGQVGNFVYTPSKREYSNCGRKIKIFQ